eukprot:850503_1
MSIGWTVTPGPNAAPLLNRSTPLQRVTVPSGNIQIGGRLLEVHEQVLSFLNNCDRCLIAFFMLFLETGSKRSTASDRETWNQFRNGPESISFFESNDAFKYQIGKNKSQNAEWLET